MHLMGYSSCLYLAFGEIGIKSICVSFASRSHNTELEAELGSLDSVFVLFSSKMTK